MIFGEINSTIDNIQGLLSFLEDIQAKEKNIYSRNKCLNPPNDLGKKTLLNIKKFDKEIAEQGYRPFSGSWATEEELNKKERVTTMSTEKGYNANYNRILLFERNDKWYGTKLIRYQGRDYTLVYNHKEKNLVISNLKQNNYQFVNVTYKKKNNSISGRTLKNKVFR